MIIALISGVPSSSFADKPISLNTLITDVKQQGKSISDKGMFEVDLDNDGMLESVLSKGMFELDKLVFGSSKSDYAVEVRGITVKGVLSCVVIKMTGVNNYSIFRAYRDVHFGRINYDIAGGVSTNVDLVSLLILSVIITAAKETIKNDKSGIRDRRADPSVFLNEWSAFLHSLLRYCSVNTDVNIIDVLGTIRVESRFNPKAVGSATSKGEQAMGLFQMLPSTINDIPKAVKMARSVGGFSNLSPAEMFDIGITNIVKNALRAPAFKRSKERFKISCFNWYPSFRNKKDIDQFWPSTALLKKKLKATDLISVFECYYGFFENNFMVAFTDSYISAMNIFAKNLDKNKQSRNEAGRGQGAAMLIDEMITDFSIQDNIRSVERRVIGSRIGNKEDGRIINAVSGDFSIVLVDKQLVREYSESFSKICSSSATPEVHVQGDATNGIIFSADMVGSDEVTGTVSLTPTWPYSRNNGMSSESMSYLHYLMGDLQKFDIDPASKDDINLQLQEKVLGSSSGRWSYYGKYKVDRSAVRLMAFMDCGMDVKDSSSTVFKDGSLLATLKSKIFGSTVDMTALTDAISLSSLEKTQMVTVQYRYPFKGL